MANTRSGLPAEVNEAFFLYQRLDTNGHPIKNDTILIPCNEVSRFLCVQISPSRSVEHVKPDHSAVFHDGTARKTSLRTSQTRKNQSPAKLHVPDQENEISFNNLNSSKTNKKQKKLKRRIKDKKASKAQAKTGEAPRCSSSNQETSPSPILLFNIINSLPCSYPTANTVGTIDQSNQSNFDPEYTAEQERKRAKTSFPILKPRTDVSSYLLPRTSSQPSSGGSGSSDNNNAGGGGTPGVTKPRTNDCLVPHESSLSTDNKKIRSLPVDVKKKESETVERNASNTAALSKFQSRPESVTKFTAQTSLGVSGMMADNGASTHAPSQSHGLVNVIVHNFGSIQTHDFAPSATVQQFQHPEGCVCSMPCKRGGESFCRAHANDLDTFTKKKEAKAVERTASDESFGLQASTSYHDRPDSNVNTAAETRRSDIRTALASSPSRSVERIESDHSDDSRDEAAPKSSRRTPHIRNSNDISHGNLPEHPNCCQHLQCQGGGESFCRAHANDLDTFTRKKEAEPGDHIARKRALSKSHGRPQSVTKFTAQTSLGVSGMMADNGASTHTPSQSHGSSNFVQNFGSTQTHDFAPSTNVQQYQHPEGCICSIPCKIPRNEGIN